MFSFRISIPIGPQLVRHKGQLSGFPESALCLKHLIKQSVWIYRPQPYRQCDRSSFSRRVSQQTQHVSSGSSGLGGTIGLSSVALSAQFLPGIVMPPPPIRIPVGPLFCCLRGSASPIISGWFKFSWAFLSRHPSSYLSYCIAFRY